LVFTFTPSSSGNGQTDTTHALGITAVNGTITDSSGAAVDTSGADGLLSNFVQPNGTPIGTEHLGVNEAGMPAGVAGEPINLALTNPANIPDGPITVTFSGMPSDWRLNQGTNLGNGTWTVETNDLTALTVLTAAAYAGAMVLGVTETWTNPDGSTGSAFVRDNVEAYAPGSPIFALSGDDTLTGAGANDLFVFAQPIGNDVIYNFNVASDKIDLVGFDGVSSFADVHVADDANGNAVVTVGSGETITLHGVDASLLTASNFEFDQTPTLDNSGTMTISDGAILPLSGVINNSGTIELNSTGDMTELQITGDGITLEGGGQIILSDSAGNEVVGTNHNAILTNVDNTISGVGEIGTGDGNLVLVNEAAGTIDANVAGGVLTLDTGNAIVNYGLLEATSGGTLQVQDAVIGGAALISGGTMEFDAAASVAVTFDNGASGTSYGVLILIDPSHFTGDISGFAGTAPDLAHSDGIDVVGIDFNSAQFSDAYDSSTGVLTLSDGTDTASLQFSGFKGDIQDFHFAEDANGTGTLITDPPGLESSASVSLVSSDTTDSQQSASQIEQNASVAIGGTDGDHFVFTPGIGAETVTNFNVQQDTIELDQFASAQTVQELQSLITNDVHGDAVINLGSHDSITLPGVSADQLQQVVQAGHILLH
jgi:hypothetical protein